MRQWIRRRQADEAMIIVFYVEYCVTRTNQKEVDIEILHIDIGKLFQTVLSYRTTRQTKDFRIPKTWFQAEQWKKI